MSDKAEREEKAFESLIFGTLRHYRDKDLGAEDIMDDSDVELSEEDREASERLGSDILSALEKRAQEQTGKLVSPETEKEHELEPEAVTMFRGDSDLPPEAEEELKRRRKEILDDLDEEKEPEDDGERDSEDSK